MKGPSRVSTSRLRALTLVVAMVASIAGVALFETQAERREAAASMRRIAGDQTLVAEVLAAEFADGLERVARESTPHSASTSSPTVSVRDGAWIIERGDAPRESIRIDPSRILHGDDRLERGEHRLLLHSRQTGLFRMRDGVRLAMPELVAAVEAGRRSVILVPAQARRLGLPDVDAVAGIASTNVAGFGRWTVLVVRSAIHQRERAAQTTQRSVGSTVLVSLIVLGFGTLLLRSRWHEDKLADELAKEETRTLREEELARATRAATVLTFAAGIAHEVSSPLSVIGMRAEQIETKAETEGAIRASRAILEQVSRIRDLMRRFLEIARGGEPAREPFSSRGMLEGVVEHVRHRFDRGGVALVSRFGDSLPPIRGDARLVEHAVTNLVTNARDASEPGDSVEIGATVVGDFLEIVVADRGPGIAAAERARVLEPFVSTKPDGHGTGLGLALANEIARIHRGSLELLPRDGGGTSAVIRFPVVETREDHDADPNHKQARATSPRR